MATRFTDFPLALPGFLPIIAGNFFAAPAKRIGEFMSGLSELSPSRRRQKALFVNPFRLTTKKGGGKRSKNHGRNEMNIAELNILKEQALSEVAQATASSLETLRIKYLGRKGLLPEIMQNLKSIPNEEKPLFGRAVNAFKEEFTAALTQKEAATPAKSHHQAFDLTLPGYWHQPGTIHPLNALTREIVGIFHSLGFTVASGPDVEDNYHNFEALNIPADHPARDSQDTLYLTDELALRPQTSTIQVRYMETHNPPVRIIAPGRCYRRDTPDATHSANFHQVEGLYVDKHVSLADLKSDLAYFARELMGPKTKIRFRPHFFPFTEPSLEFDFSCHICAGKGCRVCKNSGWIEISGAGLVNANVLRAVGYDPNEVTGYAFGMGIERIAMILYGIADLRLFYENDLRFLRQF